MFVSCRDVFVFRRTNRQVSCTDKTSLQEQCKVEEEKSSVAFEVVSQQEQHNSDSKIILESIEPPFGNILFFAVML